jgi:hypothetical protein
VGKIKSHKIILPSVPPLILAPKQDRGKFESPEKWWNHLAHSDLRRSLEAALIERGSYGFAGEATRIREMLSRLRELECASPTLRRLRMKRRMRCARRALALGLLAFLAWHHVALPGDAPGFVREAMADSGRDGGGLLSNLAPQYISRFLHRSV